MVLKVKKLSADALLPQYAHPGDAGLDVFATEDREHALMYLVLAWRAAGFVSESGLAGVPDGRRGYRAGVRLAPTSDDYAGYAATLGLVQHLAVVYLAVDLGLDRATGRERSHHGLGLKLDQRLGHRVHDAQCVALAVAPPDTLVQVPHGAVADSARSRPASSTQASTVIGNRSSPTASLSASSGASTATAPRAIASLSPSGS
jgi:hypothetical protein